VTEDQRNTDQPVNSALTITRILVPFALGYSLSYLFRVVNAVLAPDLTSELDLNAEDLGLLTATYFITFAAFQLPLGILLDRYGPRRIEAILLIFAAVGAYLFSRGDSITTLTIGRGLIGFGVSACLMAAFKAFTQWFQAHQLPMVNGIIMAAGGFGALIATSPVQSLLAVTDWRGIFLALAGITLLAAILVYVLVPDASTSANKDTVSQQLKGIKFVFGDAFFWRVAPVTMFSQASFISVQSLWAGPWLRDVGGLSRVEAADHLFLIAFSMVMGFLAIGGIATRLARAGFPTIRVAGLGMFIFMLVQGLIISGIMNNLPTPVWMAFGFFGTTGIVQYAVLSQRFDRTLSGRVMTAINLMVFIAAFWLQWMSGAVIDLWPQLEPGRYQPESYQVAFGVLLLLQVLSFLWFALPRRRK